ncbi:hypothetical protein MRX96_020898 [Rhipicephalus microplus]
MAHPSTTRVAATQQGRRQATPTVHRLVVLHRHQDSPWPGMRVLLPHNLLDHISQQPWPRQPRHRRTLLTTTRSTPVSCMCQQLRHPLTRPVHHRRDHRHHTPRVPRRQTKDGRAVSRMHILPPRLIMKCVSLTWLG